MSSLFSPIKPGTWWLRSESDPRWRASGSGHVGGFAMPRDCAEAIERLKAEFGDPPKDLEWGYMKN